MPAYVSRPSGSSSWKIPRGADRAVDSGQGFSGSSTLAGVLVERPSLGGRGFRFGEQLANWNVEGFGDVDQPLVQNPAFAVFDIDQNVPGDSRSEGQGFLGHPFLKPDDADIPANYSPRLEPLGHALGIVLARARRHASK